MEFQNKTALITGGSSGIGLALARSLSAMGANVWLLARHPDMLETALASVQEAKLDPAQNCGVVACDVTDENQVSVAVDHVSQAVGVPDLLINSAGVAHPGYVEELDDKIFHWMMDVNYFGTVHMIKACLPGMLKRGSGHIVNISSIAGFIGVFGYTAYGASKFAVSGFSDVLRAELKPCGIRVSIVFPPDTKTAQLDYENQFKPVETKALAGTTKAMTAEEVAKVILKGVTRGKYVILPGMEANLLYRLSGIFGNAVYPVMDYMIAQSRNGNARTNHK